VLADGTVFFTLNGVYLGINSEDPKIPLNAQVFSTVYVAGYSAHLRFIFDQQSFMFTPSKSFEVYFLFFSYLFLLFQFSVFSFSLPAIY